jgi:hypothetical protein
MPYKSVFGQTLVSIFFGAGFALGGGYLAFRLQQRFIRERVERDQFEARKVEYSSTLWDFFQGDTYSNLMAGDNDLEIVQEVRRYMIEKGIYPLLPNESLKLLNQLCDETKKSKESRSELLGSNLKIHFKEFLF